MSSQLLLTSIQEVNSTNDLIPLLKDFRNSDNANLRTAEARDALLSVTRLVTSPEAVFWFGKCFSWFATPPEGQELCASATAPSAANSVTAQQQQNQQIIAASITPNNNLLSLADAFIFAARAATTPESVRMLTIAINNICCNERAREKFFANRPELRDAFLLMARPASATVSATDVWSRAVNQICNDSINGKTLFAVPQFASIMMDPIARKGLSLSQPPAAGSPTEAFAAVHSAVQHWSEVLQSLLSGKNYPGTVFDSFATPELWRTIQEVAEKLLRPSDPRQASVFVESFRPHFERALVSVVHHSPEFTQAFLEAGLSPNIEGPRGGKLIHQACGGGRIPIIKLLLKFGASIHDVNEEKNTPLHQACSSGNSDLVQFLLENGASADAKNSLKETPLDVAKRCQRRQAQKVMEDFFKAGNAVFGNNNNNNGATTSTNNNNNSNNDNDALLKNKNGFVVPAPPPPSQTATIMTGGHPIVISHSLPGITFGNNNHTGINNNHLLQHQQPQFQVYHDDDKEVTEYLKLDHSNLGGGGGGGSNSNSSSHHDPIYEQNGGDASLAARQMKLFDLVSKGKTRLFAKLDATRSFGPIRVEEELKDKSQMMHVATQWEQLEFAELLLKKGASVACKDAAGQQPLHRCAAWNRVDGSEWLLRNGAQVNALDAHGRSPLMYSALYGHAKVTQYLLQHGANKDLRDHNGKNARSLAEERQNKKVVRLLDGLPVTIDNNTVTFDPVKNVVSVTSGIQSQYSSSPMPSISVGGIVTSGGTPGSNGSTTLSPPNQGIVISPNNSSVLQNNNSTLTNNANTLTPTHITGVGTILTNEKYTHNQMLLGRKIVKLANNGYHEVLRETVIHQGADVNFRDPENGRTALHSACAAGNFLNTRVLLECGADVNIRNGDGETARDLAMRTQRKRVLEVFDEFAPLDSFALQQQQQQQNQHQRRVAGGGAAASTLTGISSQQQQLQPILTNQIPLGSILLGSGLPLHQQQHVLLHHHHHHHHHHHMAPPVLVPNPFNNNNSSHLAPVFIDPSLNNIHHHHHHHFNNNPNNNRVGAPGGIIFGAAGGNGTTTNALPLSPSSSSSSSPAAGTAELEATVRFLREHNETLLRNNRNLENDTATLKQENEALKKKLEEIKRMFNF